MFNKYAGEDGKLDLPELILAETEYNEHMYELPKLHPTTGHPMDEGEPPWKKRKRGHVKGFVHLPSHMLDRNQMYLVRY
jgi:hypothetical protein